MKKIDIMGIVNLTGDSYFPDSRNIGDNGDVDVDKVLMRVEKHISEGADIIDIGACSTRPGSLGVGFEEEWRRIGAVLHEIHRTFPSVTISIDTYWSEIVRRCHDVIGKFIVNDISAGLADSSMLKITGELGLQYVAMHMRGMPENMQSFTDYTEGVLNGVVSYFNDFSKRAEENGIEDWILDPGFGFSKTLEQNYELMRDLGRLGIFGKKILVGVSRKSMIYRLFDITPDESLPATQALHFAALASGADILRVHDVREAAQTVEIFSKLHSE